jgi:hypothetical protein
MHMLVQDEEKYNKVEQIALALQGMKDVEIEALARVLDSVRKTRKHGYAFFQRVFVRYTGVAGSNYISNFAACRVIYSDKEYVRLISESGKTFLTLINEKNNSAILKPEEFVELRRKMLAERKFVDPKEQRLTKTSKLGKVADLDEVARQDQMNDKTRKGLGRAKEDSHGRIVSRILRNKTGGNGRKYKYIDKQEIQM